MTNDVIDVTAERMAAVQAFILHHMEDSQQVHMIPGLPFALPDWISLHGLMVIIGSIFLILLAVLGRHRNGAVPRGIPNFLEAFVAFIRDQIAVPFLGPKDGIRMTPLFCSFFSFIVMLNLMGLVPAFSAATANINVTGALALVVLGFMVLGSMIRQGPIGFFRGFCIPGVPWPVLILLVPLEMMGLLIKALALTIRLFANMLGGHIVVFSLIGLMVIYGWMALPSLAMAIMIYLLEIGVAILQAYIFTLLSAIFIGERYQESHG